MTDCQGTAIDGDHCRTGQRHTFRRGRPRLLPFIWCRDGARRIWLPMGQCWRTGDRCPRGPMGCRAPGPCPGASQDCDGEAIIHEATVPEWRFRCRREQTPILIMPSGGFLCSLFPRRCQDLSPKLFGRWCYGIGNFPLGVCAPWYVPATLAA